MKITFLHPSAARKASEDGYWPLFKDDDNPFSIRTGRRELGSQGSRVGHVEALRGSKGKVVMFLVKSRRSGGLKDRDPQ
jgi:hypothetical protein